MLTSYVRERISSREGPFRGPMAFILAMVTVCSVLALPLISLADDSLVLVNSDSAYYDDFQQYIQPYLDHFGIPYTTLDIASQAVGTSVGNYAVIIVGHRQLDLDGLYLDATEEGNISAAIDAGTGLVNFDNALSGDGTTPAYQFVDDIFRFGYMATPTGSGVTFTSEGYTGVRINCWEDDHQDPILTTTENPADLVVDDGQWTEFLWVTSRDYPSVLAGADEEDVGLPVMRFYASGIPNGEYEVLANLYTNVAGRDMRYFYGYSPDNPKAYYVDTVGGAGGSDQHQEYSLGTVDVTDGTFEIYVQDADMLGGVYEFFGWAWIRLVQGGAPAAEMHYITERHEAGESIGTGSMTLAGISLPENVSALAMTGSQPFLAVTTYGSGRAVQWGTYDWMSYSVKGPLYGLDDLVWRSIVWAARKPFVMQGMPPFLTMRVDDESGPFWWLHIANEFGFKPWAGLFFHNIDETEATDLSTLVNAGQATTSIHAFNGGFFYFNHSGSDWPDATLAAYYAEGTQWHQDHNIPISKFMLPHYYEIGTNAFQGLTDWGVEFIGTQMDPGNGYGAPWIMNGPYRLYETGSSGWAGPGYYADFLTVPGHPEFDGQFFNCVTEIRDDAGYEWYPSSDVPGSIGRGTRQCKRALDSMALATLFTHGYFMGGIGEDSWRATLQGITSNLAPYNPIYVTMDYACQYIRAMHNSQIGNSTYDPIARQVTTTLTGTTDMPTMFFLFTEETGVVVSQLLDVPTFSGSTDVVYTLAGPLDHIVVTPSSATVAAGGSQQFTAQGYDVDNNPIPNLPFTWSVVNGGGAISQNGLFTAGAAAGLYSDTVEASIGGIQGFASVDVVTPALDHFTIETVSGPQYVDAPFLVTLTARDVSGNLLIGYGGPAALSDSTDTIYPSVTGSFSGGVWTGNVTVGQVAHDVTITVTDGAATGTSNAFEVEDVPNYYQVTSPSYIQTAGVPFPVSVSLNTGTTFNCWDNSHQDPILAATSDVNTLINNSANAQWTEFLYTQSRPYPVVMASALHTAGLPTMHFYGYGIPNGRYEVIANLYDNAAMRYFFGYTADNPTAVSVDTTGGATGTQCREYSLGMVEVTDNSIHIYVNNAQLLTAGGYDIFGWASIRLVPDPTPQEIKVNLWEDDHQDPVLATTSDVNTLINNAANAQWTEFLYTSSRPYPVILASVLHTAGLPTMNFFAGGVPNGRYEVIANLYDNAAMRYFFGYTAADPSAMSVDTAGGATGTQCREYSLGVVEITDNSFDLYVNNAQLVAGGYEMFGWAWVRLVPAITVNLWENDHQDPVLATTSDVGILTTNSANALWTEFLYSATRPYPLILASALHTAGLATMNFYADGIPNGLYEVVANLYDNAAMRYFFGYTEADPGAMFVDTAGGATGTQCREYSLGTVEITDNSFNFFVNNAQLLTPGGYDLFGWSWIRLVPFTMITMNSDSPTMLFDADENGIFGEPNDSVKALLGGTMDIMAVDAQDGTDVSIIAMDDLGLFGENTYSILPALPDEPTFISLDPDSGGSAVGVPRVFSLTVGDGDGYEDITSVRFWINAGPAGSEEDAIIVEYWKEYNKIIMFNHNEGRYRGGAPGSAVVVEDDLCVLDLSQTTVEGDGDLLTINWHITPKADFVGDKRIWVQVRDLHDNLLRSLEIGSWTVSLGQPYTLSVGTNPVDGGTTSPGLGDHVYTEGEVVTVTASANPGFIFLNWTGDVADPNAQTTTVTMDANKTVTANFDVVSTFTLSIDTNPLDSGTTSPALGDHDYSDGEVVTLTASANPGFIFLNWTGDVADPNAQTTTVTMDADKTVTANFDVVDIFTLTMVTNPPDGGTTSPALGDHDYSDGEVVTLTASAYPGFAFLNWAGDVADPNAQTTTVTMDADKTVTANFEAVTTTSTFTVDYYLKGNIGDRTYDRIGPTLPCPPVYTFEITRADFVDAGFNTLAGDLYTFSISHMHNGDKVDNPENWVVSFDDGSVVTTIGTLSYSALAFIDDSMLGTFDLSGPDWKFILSETSDDGPYDGDRLFIDKAVITSVSF